MGEVVVVATGAQAARCEALGLRVVASVDAVPEDARAVAIAEPGGFANEPRVAYAARPAIDDALLKAVAVAIGEGCALEAPPDKLPATTPAEARRAQRAFTASRRLATAPDLRGTETIAIEQIQDLVGADRAHCLFFQVDDGSLWSEAAQQGPDGDDRRAVGGVAGWCAYTGIAANIERTADEPRWVAAIDDPEGDGTSRLLVQPIVGADRVVHAVLVAVRAGRTKPFSDEDADQLARFAHLAAPLLDQMSSAVEAQQVIDDAEEGAKLFRKEARDAAEPQRWGDIVRVSPPWLAWAYRALVVLLLASAVFIIVGHVSTYSSGAAVIRSTARTSITANVPGNVSAVDARAGDRVERGAVIARLDDADQRAAVDRLDREFETQLRNHMLDPNDMAADASLRTLRLQLEQARASLDERLIRARTSGTLTDVRVRPGQRVEPGEIVGSLVEGGGGLEVVALLPGEDRPQLANGMQMRVELTGYRYAYQHVPIDSVSADVIAASEARRILGADVADGLAVGGSVVVVRGRLAREDFEVDGQTYRYHDGMTGKAEVRLRSERIVFAIVPGLRRLGE